MAGRILNSRYELGELVGTGDMADVYRATDNLLGRNVAVKILHQEYTEDAAYIELFRKDAQAATNINNPNVIDVYDWGVEEGTCYLVMEYVEEVDLRDIIVRAGRLTPERAVGIAIALCSALEAAHTAGIMNNDLSPQNVIVTQDNRVKVMGFGVPSRSGESRSDLYSLGMVVYEMLTSGKPLEEREAAAMAVKRVGHGTPPPSSINPEISPALDAIVAKALSGNPESRYHSVQAMRADLQHYLESPRPTGAPRARDGGRLAGVASGVGRVAGRVADSVRSRPWIWAGVLVLVLAGIGVGVWALVKGPGSVTVPNLSGKTQAEVKQLLSKSNLKLGKTTSESSATLPKGQAISQKPEPGSKVQQNTKVDIVASKGPDLVQVPDCRNLTQAEATAKLKEAKLEVAGITQENSPDVQSGKVLAQSPEAGAEALAGSTVALTVSKGMQMVIVPRVVGLTKDSAVSQLKSKGINAEVQEVQATAQTPGIVYEQDPQAGKSVGTGTNVIIRVAVKPKLVSVPSVVGMSLDAAKKRLLDAKLGVGYGGTPKPTDRVVAQEPAANTQVNENSEVKLFFQ